MIDLVSLISAQRDLQLRLGTDFGSMSPEERRNFIVENVLAATDELHEALNETGWKSWATSRHLNEEAFFGELRDCWQLLTNLMLVIESDPDKLAKLFADKLIAKLAVNHARVDSNYDGVTTKCPGCSRALEDVTITEVSSDSVTRFYCICGIPLDESVVRGLLSD